MSIYNTTNGTYYNSLSAAIIGSSAGDTVQISAGGYVEDFPDITHSLTISAVGGQAFLTTTQPIPVNGRAILNVPVDGNVSLTISGLSLSGAVDAPSRNNGAGILFETGNGTLTVLNSHIFNNQDGILTGAADAASTAGMAVVIRNSELDHNGVAPGNPSFGFDHNLYAGAVSQLTVQQSYLHDALGGHEIKSRSQINIITGNRIEDGATAPTSYSIDLANGGQSTIDGNVIEKGATSPNRNVVHFAGEGTYPNSSLVVSNNTIINDRTAGATGLLNQSKDVLGANISADIHGNTLYGIDPVNLFQDDFGPPFDTTRNNVFPESAAPPLDTSSPFAVPEPASIVLLMAGVLALTVLRAVRRSNQA